MKKMKVLLIFTAFADVNEIRGEKKKILWEPLGVEYLKSYLERDNYEVDILYPLIEEMTMEDVNSYLEENSEKYGMIGISSATFNVETTKNLVSVLKNKCAYKGAIILGGLGPSCVWEKFLDTGVDAIIIGEGEKTILRIVQTLEHGKSIYDINGIAYINEQGDKIRNGYVDLIENLDDNVFPSRGIALKIAQKIDKKHVHIQIQSSRGCYGNCSFCSISRLLKEQGGSRWRSRSAENIVEEIAWLNQTYGFTKFDFMDENFFPSDKNKAVEKAKAFYDCIQKHNLECEFFIQFQLQVVSKELIDILQKCNVKSIFIGIDSFENECLKIYNKLYNEKQVVETLDFVIDSKFGFSPEDEYRIKIGYINFNPLSTVESLKKSGKMFKKYDITYKKLFTKLRIDDEKSKVYENIIKIFPEYSQDNYFKNKEIEVAYTQIQAYFDHVISDRSELRNLEVIYDDFKEDSVESNFVRKLRKNIDDLMWSVYMKALDLVEEKKLQEIKRYVAEAIQLYDQKKTEWEVRITADIEKNSKLDYLKLSNMHVKEYD